MSKLLYTSSDTTATLELDNTGAGGNSLKAEKTGGAGSTISVTGANASPTIDGENSSTGVGVKGGSTGGSGVLGVTAAGSPNAGVTGQCGTNGIGISGSSTGASGVGVGGATDTGIGVSAAATGAGIALLAQSTSGDSIFAINTHGSGHFALRAQGDVLVVNDFTVSGVKSAAVPNAAGQMVRLYATESPESWFEDFGSGRIVNGRGIVRIPADFLEVVRGDYRVFLTPLGDCNGLYVVQKDQDGFVVGDLQNGQATIDFDWRVVAKRADVEAPRFEPVFIEPGDLGHPHSLNQKRSHSSRSHSRSAARVSS